MSPMFFIELKMYKLKKIRLIKLYLISWASQTAMAETQLCYSLFTAYVYEILLHCLLAASAAVFEKNLLAE